MTITPAVQIVPTVADSISEADITFTAAVAGSAVSASDAGTAIASTTIGSAITCYWYLYMDIVAATVACTAITVLLHCSDYYNCWFV